MVVLFIIDPNGLITTLTYDTRQRLTSRTVGGETSAYAYDNMGQLTQITLPDGQQLHYTWDGAHRLTGIADGLGNSLHYTLDAAGNRLQEDIKDPAQQLTRTRRHIYDALGRLAQDIGAQNQRTHYEYDAKGNRTKVTDPQNHITASAYDALDRLIQLTDPGNGQTRFAYDGQDHLTQVTDPRNLVTAYNVDGLGNTPQETSPDTGTTTRTHDAAGNELTRTDAKGQTTATQYDALDRPTQITYHDGTKTQVTWDQGTNGKGRLTQLEEREGSAVTATHTYAYDGPGRIVQETRTEGARTYNQHYTYTQGQLTSHTLPSGRRIDYTRNGHGQIIRLTLTDIAPHAGQARTVARAITYHPFGGLKSWIDGAGQTHTRPQDQDGRISGYTLAGVPWILSYDAAGRIIGQIDGTNAAHSAIYGYDPLDRLTQAKLPNVSHSYSYDATGNRTNQSTGATNRSYTIDPTSNRLTTLSNPTQTLIHDANGSLVGDGQSAWQYDARGRLIETSTAAGAVRYRVDAQGRRVKKTLLRNGVKSAEFSYHYDQGGHLIGESDATGNMLREYLWLGDIPLAVIQ
jgi:YD repeat-containing protein